MTTFTSSLPENLLQQLQEKSKEFGIPKNKIIEKALSLYLEQLNKAAYVHSYKEMSEDVNLFQIAEEGMAEYYKELKDPESL
jgi:hypothetical protein